MVFDASPPLAQVLILKADLLCASMLEHVVRRVYPAAEFRRETTLAKGLSALSVQAADLLVTGIGLPDGDALDLLTQGGKQQKFRRALVVTGRSEHRILASLLDIHGIFDPTSESLEEFERAVRTVAEGGRYWSPSVVERLHGDTAPVKSICRLLSPTEQLVLAVLGDGSDDDTAAQRLKLKRSTIHSVRRELHRKLGVQHRGELVRMAAQHGYVRFTPSGVQRPGFAALLAACGKK